MSASARKAPKARKAKYQVLSALKSCAIRGAQSFQELLALFARGKCARSFLAPSATYTLLSLFALFAQGRSA